MDPFKSVEIQSKVDTRTKCRYGCEKRYVPNIIYNFRTKTYSTHFAITLMTANELQRLKKKKKKINVKVIKKK